MEGTSECVDEVCVCVKLPEGFVQFIGNPGL